MKVHATSLTWIFVHFYLWSFPLNPSVSPVRFRGNFYFPGENSFISTLKKTRLELKSKVPELSLNQNY